jgi:hypothetical protein
MQEYERSLFSLMAFLQETLARRGALVHTVAFAETDQVAKDALEHPSRCRAMSVSGQCRAKNRCGRLP